MYDKVKRDIMPKENMVWHAIIRGKLQQMCFSLFTTVLIFLKALRLQRNWPN